MGSSVHEYLVIGVVNAVKNALFTPKRADLSGNPSVTLKSQVLPHAIKYILLMGTFRRSIPVNTARKFDRTGPGGRIDR